jgi:outer membrane protein assembly complex protein YaeT
VELAFEGDPLPRARVDDLVPVKREGAVDEDLLEDSKRRVEQYLRSEGFWKAAADYRRTESGGKLAIVFTVTRGRPFEVARLEVTGIDPAEREPVLERLSLQPGRPFVEDLLERDAAVVLRYLQEQGHAQAKVTPRVEETGGPDAARGGVIVGLAVDKGPRSVVGAIQLEGHAAVDEGSLRKVMQLRAGGPFFAPWLAADRAAVESAYRNRGFADARVSVAATPAAGEGLADLTYRIFEGNQAIARHVIVTGNERTSVDTILREARLVPGQPVGVQDLADAQRRLSALGLFRRVRVDAVQEPGETFRNIVISVEENAVTTVGYGAGVEGGRQLRREDAEGSAVEQFEFAPRGFFEVSRRNLWGKNRSVTLFSRASLRRDPDDTDDGDPGGYGLYEYRVLGTYREPRAFGLNADAAVTGLLEQAIRSSFSYRRRGVTAGLSRRLASSFTVGTRYWYSYTNVYEDRSVPADQPLIDRLFPQVRLSVVAGLAAWDTRDDVIEPTRGHLIGVESDLATRALGSEVGYSKSFMQAFLYRQLPGTRVVFAGGARLGLATGFPREVPRTDEDGNPVLDAEGDPIVDTVKDLPASERFYAGGDTTVRGYTLDRLGDDDTIDQDGFPLGGDAVVIFNGELRFPVTPALGGVVFVDAGNVFARVTQLDLSRIRATTGFGVRYKSPIGPLRVDLGFKLDPRVQPNGTRERGYAVHISVGQAF